MKANTSTISRRTGLTATAAALLAGVSGAPGATASQRTPHAASSLQKDVDAIRAAGVSGILAEVQGAHGRTSARAGVADLAAKGPVPWGAYYRIGSDTKTVTATVVLQLVGEGRLKLTDTVDRWLPGAVRGHGNDGRRITVTNLLRQTSGLNDYFAAGAGDLTPASYRRHRFRSQTPAEQLTAGHPWAQEVHERIIEPLGLRHTLIPGTSSYVPGPTATAYTYFPGDSRPADTTLNSGGGADGGIITTPHDHGVFLRALMSGRLVRPAQLAAMKQTVPAADLIPVPGVRYGLGIAWRPVAGRDDGIWFHGGTSLGCVSECGVTPDGSMAVTSAAFTLRLGGPQAARTLRMVDSALRAGSGGSR
ncbi:serine hydrolase domain-containing protein [Streptomyces sp. MZ04]|uniref:serine hydrolase domain-containing protein n=1 Tax=Streptomyces sp. MZ04 TaxID=2559236 RepID=UPI00107E7856|nr:serine hydrolase domain-containing protein [Streptomyces sp. MZ04]TGB15838.1 class A beta-lactamase-related serine hydrolase [Streptomyces sp. MZ04]